MQVLRQGGPPTEVLLIHAPYPGRLKFAGVPSSLFAAAGPLVGALSPDAVSYLDPIKSTPEFYMQLRSLLESGKCRVLCISSSTAAIWESRRIASIAQEVSPRTLVVLGGPHEDASPKRSAFEIPGVHVSIAGQAQDALKRLVENFLEKDELPEAFLSRLRPSFFEGSGIRGAFSVACRSWRVVVGFEFPGRPIPIEGPLIVPERYPRFDVFAAKETIPLMVSDGCSYGQCTFCDESRGGYRLAPSFEWVEQLALSRPGAALYFQDSIFASGNRVRDELLPTLSRLGREWGCQVFLPTLSERMVRELADAGCRYLYTGLESGSNAIWSSVAKGKVTRRLVMERMKWIRDTGMCVGVSLMFGSMNLKGELVETGWTVAQTAVMASRIADSGVTVAGFYANVQTVLPGTALAHGLARAGKRIDFFFVPRNPFFDGLEDGGVGYNFANIGGVSNVPELAKGILRCASYVQQIGMMSW